jgi:hypothetical protein
MSTAHRLPPRGGFAVPNERRNDMKTHDHQRPVAVAGDWLEVAGVPGCPARHGLVLEVLGRPGHEHYRVRWDEEHESLFFPTEGVHVLDADEAARRA